MIELTSDEQEKLNRIINNLVGLEVYDGYVITSIDYRPYSCSISLLFNFTNIKCNKSYKEYSVIYVHDKGFKPTVKFYYNNEYKRCGIMVSLKIDGYKHIGTYYVEKENFIKNAE